MRAGPAKRAVTLPAAIQRLLATRRSAPASLRRLPSGTVPPTPTAFAQVRQSAANARSTRPRRRVEVSAVAVDGELLSGRRRRARHTDGRARSRLRPSSTHSDSSPPGSGYAARSRSGDRCGCAFDLHGAGSGPRFRAGCARISSSHFPGGWGEPRGGLGVLALGAMRMRDPPLPPLPPPRRRPARPAGFAGNQQHREIAVPNRSRRTLVRGRRPYDVAATRPRGGDQSDGAEPRRCSAPRSPIVRT